MKVDTTTVDLDVERMFAALSVLQAEEVAHAVGAFGSAAKSMVQGALGPQQYRELQDYELAVLIYTLAVKFEELPDRQRAWHSAEAFRTALEQIRATTR